MGAAFALRIGNEQSVPPPPNFASRSARLRIESDGSTFASNACVSNGTTMLSGLRRRMAAATRAATSTHRIFDVTGGPFVLTNVELTYAGVNAGADIRDNFAGPLSLTGVRAWLEKRNVFNTQSVAQVEKALAARKS